ncbi:hypothetical protein ACJ7RV_002195 [Vibrio parahaemolyticus]
MKGKIKKAIQALILLTIGFSMVLLIFFLYFIYLFPVSMRHGNVDALNLTVNEVFSEMYIEINRILKGI